MRRTWLGVVAALAVAGCTGAPADVSGPLQPTAAPPPATTRPVAEVAEEFKMPGCPETDPGAEAVEGGLPRTQLPCLTTGEPVNLAGLPREPMVINLWAQWCGPCREESPFLREAFQQVDGVRFVGINYQDPQPDWAVEFAGLAGWKYAHVQDMDRTLRGPLAVPGLPTTLFVAADGTIAGRHAGKLESTQQLKDLVKQHLGVS